MSAHPGGTDPRPHVVMLVANDVTADTRVRKSALAVAALGARVTVVGLTAGPRREESLLGDVRILRVPVDFVLRDRRRDRRARLHRGEVPLLTPDRDAEALDRRRATLAERDAAAREGLPGELARRLARGRWFTLRASGAGRRQAAKAATLAFKVYDRGVQRTTLAASPERVVPEIDDLELAVGPVLDELAPDAIHAHDVHFLAVTGRAVARARRGTGSAPGRTVPWVYDAHEWVPGLSRYGGRTARVVAAWAALERRWAARADRVITVSPPLAVALQERHHLARLPDVVLNVPPMGARDAAVGSVREAAGVGPDTPLLVYSGGVQAARGVETAVEALVHLTATEDTPAAHLAVVAVPNVHTPGVAAVVARAQALGVEDRVHVLAPVAPDQVVAFLSSADVGLIPLRHFGSHEMALANKLFEYLHAGVPMAVSDCRAQAEFVREHGLGEVHRAGDGADLAAAVRRVLAARADPASGLKERLADPELLARYTWDAQARVLQGLYRDLLPRFSGVLLADPPMLAAAEPPERALDEGTCALVVGPANSAGQGWAWSRAAAAHLPGVTGWCVALRNERYDYPADELVDRQDYLTGGDWQLRMLSRARSVWTHALLEAGRPLLGGLVGRDFVGDVAVLRDAGVQVGLVFHGSEVRSPRRHRQTHEFSPFADPKDELTRTLQARCDALLPLVAQFDGPTFVSTPDQLTYLPDARWLPVVVDTTVFSPAAPDAPPVLERDRPLFVHAPSNPRLKGTADVERVLQPLADKGLIELRMVTGMAPAEAAALVRCADVVVDQLLLGLYGVLACEAMASGRVVLGHLGEPLRSVVLRDAGAPVPVIETNPRTLDDVVTRVLDDREWARSTAHAGPGFVGRVHDGRRSAAVLSDFLGVVATDPEVKTQ